MKQYLLITYDDTCGISHFNGDTELECIQQYIFDDKEWMKDEIEDFNPNSSWDYHFGKVINEALEFKESRLIDLTTYYDHRYSRLLNQIFDAPTPDEFLKLAQIDRDTLRPIQTGGQIPVTKSKEVIYSSKKKRKY